MVYDMLERAKQFLRDYSSINNDLSIALSMGASWSYEETVTLYDIWTACQHAHHSILRCWIGALEYILGG